MKRRVKAQPSNPFYSNEPAVASSKIASKAPVPNPNLANKPAKAVDTHPGKLSGVVGFVDKGKPRSGPSGIKLPKLGTAAKVPVMGKLKVSGHPGAHHIGKLKV